MDLVVLGLIIIAILELILIAMLHNKITKIDNKMIGTNIDILRLMVSIGHALDRLEQKVKKLEEKVKR